MTDFSFITYNETPDAFLKHLQNTDLSNLPTTTQFELESQYRAAEIEENFKDLSFCLLHKDQLQAIILAHKYDTFIGFNGSGVEIHPIDQNDKKSLTAIIDYLIQIAKDNQCTTLKVSDLDSHLKLSPLGQELFNRRGTPNTQLRATQSLQQSEQDIRREIRKSYKSLISQGKREITFSYITHNNPDKNEFDKFQSFHKQIAERQTRPVESWDVQFKMIQAGTAELITGYMDDYGLVSSALFTDYGTTTSYAVAVYNRELFDKPLAHANVYEGMLRAKDRGQSLFNLGIIPPYSAEKEKEYNIGKFKKGFCRELSPFIEWAIPISTT